MSGSMRSVHPHAASWRVQRAGSFVSNRRPTLRARRWKHRTPTASDASTPLGIQPPVHYRSDSIPECLWQSRWPGRHVRREWQRSALGEPDLAGKMPHVAALGRSFASHGRAMLHGAAHLVAARRRSRTLSDGAHRLESVSSSRRDELCSVPTTRARNDALHRRGNAWQGAQRCVIGAHRISPCCGGFSTSAQRATLAWVASSRLDPGDHGRHQPPSAADGCD